MPTLLRLQAHNRAWFNRLDFFNLSDEDLESIIVDDRVQGITTALSSTFLPHIIARRGRYETSTKWAQINAEHS